MIQWVKVASDVVFGGAVGAVDQLLQNQDQKREQEKGEKLRIISQYGTYYNYGLPILAIIGSAFGFLKGDWASRFVIAGSTVAGRKVTWHITKRERVVAYTRWTGQRPVQTRQRAPVPQILAENQMSIPIVSHDAILV